jgi:hypothetical protein
MREIILKQDKFSYNGEKFQVTTYKYDCSWTVHTSVIQLTNVHNFNDQFIGFNGASKGAAENVMKEWHDEWLSGIITPDSSLNDRVPSHVRKNWIGKGKR